MKEELVDFLKLYPVPFEYRVMLPKRNQTIFDALDGYVGLYTHCLSLANLRLPLSKFFVMSFSIFIFKSLGLTHLVVPSSLPLPSCAKRMAVNHRLTFSGDSIVPTDCLELLSKDNTWDTKSFGDKLPDKIHEKSSFHRLGRYPTSVHVFPDPILFMAEMVFRNFMYSETDEDLTFLPKEPAPEFGTNSPTVSINTELPVIEVKQLVENTTDSRTLPAMSIL
ncbi:hypothetical protein Tco_0635541 [Tanacetum coccineum]